MTKVLSSTLEAYKLALRTLDEKTQELMSWGYGNAGADANKQQILKNYHKAFDLIAKEVQEIEAEL